MLKPAQLICVTEVRIMPLQKLLDAMQNSRKLLPKPGEYVRGLRERMRLSVRDMAQELGADGYSVDYSKLAKMECGKATMPQDLFEQYLRTLNRIWEEEGVDLGRIQASEDAPKTVA